MKKKLAIAALLLAVGGVLWFVGSRQEAAAPAAASVRPLAEVAPAAGAQAGVTVSEATRQMPSARGTLPYVVTAKATIDASFCDALAAAGAAVVTYVDETAVLVEATSAACAKVRADARVASVAVRTPSAKIEPRLAAYLAEGREKVEATVMVMQPQDLAAMRTRVVAAGGAVLDGCIEGRDFFSAEVPAKVVGELAARGDVQWLEAYERPQIFNDLAVDEELMNIRPIWKSEENPGGLSGAGQNITTSDSGIDTGDLATIHEDLRDRVFGIRVVSGANKYDSNGHGTHTAGSIVGTGKMSDGRIRGTAWGARLFAWFCGVGERGIKTPSNVGDLFQPDPENFPSYIHSGSWGSAVNGAYTAECQEMDRYVWEHPDYLPVFSAGNEGFYGRQTIGAPGSAKNVLTVGAMQNARENGDGGLGNGTPFLLGTYSSRGPCADGRIKPDVTAPGTGVLSTRAWGVNYGYGIYDDYYAFDTGTSMSCPLTAGAVALVREWLVERRGFSSEPPSSALMKAVIAGGAKDVLTPDNDVGWGRVDLKPTLYPEDASVKLVDRIPFAADTDFVWMIETTNTAPLNVHLAWVDYPGSPSARVQLVNDLDLTVEARSEGERTLWYGNGGTTYDRRNNVESVRIAEAAPGRYLISVECAKVLHDHTEGGAVALYVRGAFDPDVNLPVPEYVRIKERQLGFRSLSKALAQVQEGETVEILDTVALGESVTVDTSCTIVATNANAYATPITFGKGASFTVGTGARVLLTNVAFSGAGSTKPLSFKVAAGGTLALAGTIAGVESVTTSDETGLELAGPIALAVTVTAPDMAAGGQFGICTDPSAVDSAAQFVNPVDDEVGGLVRNGQLVWGVVPVTDEAAVARLVYEDGEYDNFRSARTLTATLRGAVTNELELVVLKDVLFTNRLSVSGTLRVRGETSFAGMPQVSQGENAKAPSAFVVQPGGSLVFSNIVFEGFALKEPLVTVEKGGVFTMSEGAILTDVRNTAGKSTSAPIVVKGEMTMEEGAGIFSCAATGSAKAGAICVYNGGAELNLAGGAIVGNATGYSTGGAVYVYSGGRVNVCGDSVVYDNIAGERGDIVGNFAFERRDALFVVGELSETAIMGVRYGANDAAANTADNDFAVVAVELGEEECARAAGAFENDADADLIAAVREDGSALFWDVYVPTIEDVPGYVAPEDAETDAVVEVAYATTTNYWDSLDAALDSLTDPLAGGDIEGDVVITLRANAELNVSYVCADRAVTLTSAAEEPYEVACLDDGAFFVDETGSFAMTNVIVRGVAAEQGAFIEVSGGALDLFAGTLISGMRGSFARGSAAVKASQGARVTVHPGAAFRNCRNSYSNPAENTGVGGAIMIDGPTSVLNLCGGEITGCAARKGGGVYVGNGAKVYVQGELVIANNFSTADFQNPVRNDVCVEDLSELYLDGTMSGRVGYIEGINAPTNMFGRVTEEALLSEELMALADSATNFQHDVTRALGVLATNITGRAVLVWSTAFGEDGTVTLGDASDADAVYAPVGEIPEIPDPTPVPVDPTPVAFTAIVSNPESATWTVTFTNLVAYCHYELYQTNSLAGGFVVEGQTPVTNFMATAAGACSLTVPAEGAALFWKVVAKPGEKPAE